MGFLRRNGGSDSSSSEPEHVDPGTLLLQGEDMIDQLARAHMSWGLGSADRWGLDQRTGIITWTFPDKTATAPAQIIGSYNPSAASWLWAWANECILPEMSRDSARHSRLGRGSWPTRTHPTEDRRRRRDGRHYCGTRRENRSGNGFYRGTGTASIPIITFGVVTLTTQEGEASTFKIDIWLAVDSLHPVDRRRSTSPQDRVHCSRHERVFDGDARSAACACVGR